MKISYRPLPKGVKRRKLTEKTVPTFVRRLSSFSELNGTG